VRQHDNRIPVDNADNGVREAVDVIATGPPACDSLRRVDDSLDTTGESPASARGHGAARLGGAERREKSKARNDDDALTACRQECYVSGHGKWFPSLVLLA
jgi:hypothetical protein